MENKFLRFSFLRVGFCVVGCAFLVFLSVMGQRLWYFYFGAGNTFVYNKGSFAVHIVDVGHGNCTIVQLPDGKTAIIDGGFETYWSRVHDYIETRIKPRGNRIDYLINSHPHSDHLDGLVHVMTSYNYGKFYYTAATADLADNPKHEKITEGLEISGENYRIKFHAVGNAFADFSEEDLDGEDPAENELSPVITIEYASQVFVLTGDAGHQTEKAFYESDSAAEIFGGSRAEQLTVYLQVGHHGSRTSTGIPFIEFIKPDIAVIPLGYLYNHPHGEVLTNLENVGASAYLTREVGNVAVQCKGNDTSMFLGYDNPPNLMPIWILAGLGVCAICFVVYKDKPQHIVVEK